MTILFQLFKKIVQCTNFSYHSGRYDYSAEREYLRNQPQTQEVTKLRVDLLYALTMRHILYFAACEKQRKFNPSQPRVPAGQTGGGQWAGDNVGHGNDDNITTDTVEPRVIPRLPIPFALLAQGALELYKRYNELTSQNQTYPNDGSA